MRASLALAALLAGAPAAAQAPDAPIGVVLGAGAAPDGWANPMLVERVCRGVAERKEGRVGALLMSGGYTSGHIAEAEMMRAVAVLAGVPASAVWLERSAVNTMENAGFSVRLAKARGASRARLVTHRSHLPWALETFRRAGEGWWVSLSTAEADGALREDCFPRLAALALATTADMLIVDVTEEVSLEEAAAREPDVPSPALARAALLAARAYRSGAAKRLYFALPEPSTGTWTATRASAHGHISAPELARILATALGVAWDDVYVSSGRRTAQVPGAVEPGEEPWLRIPGARLAVLAPAERQGWWRARLSSGLNALLPPAEFHSP